MDLQTKISRRTMLKYSAAAATTVALAACGSTSTTTSSGPLRAWIWAGAPIQQSAFKAVAAAYPTQFKNVKLDLTVVPNGDQGVAQQFSLALAAHKEIPDFMMLNYTEVPEFAEAGVLEDLGSLFSSAKNDLYSGAQKISLYNGKYVTFPWQLKSKLFYYRADLFEQAGIDPTTITTLDDFITAGKQFHAKFPKQYILNLGTQPAGYWFHELFSVFPNSSFASRTGTYDLTTNPAFSESLNLLKQIHDSGIAYPIDDFSADWPAAIKNETICGFLIADWMEDFLPGYATSAQAGKWKTTTWPKFFADADARYGSDSGGSVFVVPSGGTNKELALQYLDKLILDRQGSVASFNATGNPSVLKSAQTAMLDSINTRQKPASMTDEQWLTLPQNFFGKDYYPTEFSSYDLVRAFNYDPSALKEFTIMTQWIDQAIQGKVSVADALTGAQHDMQTQIGNPYQH